MSLQLATKGVIDGGITHSTKGVIYLQGIVEWIISVIPEFVSRRASVSKIVRRVSRATIVRREDD